MTQKPEDARPPAFCKDLYDCLYPDALPRYNEAYLSIRVEKETGV